MAVRGRLRRYAMQSQAGITIGLGRLTGVLIANAILWRAALLLAGDWRLGGPAAVALISIGSLSPMRRKLM